MITVINYEFIHFPLHPIDPHPTSPNPSMSVPSSNNFDDDDDGRPFTIIRTTVDTDNNDNNNNKNEEEEEQRATTSAPVTRRSKKQGPKLKLPPAAEFVGHVMPYSRKPLTAQSIITPHLQFGEPLPPYSLFSFSDSTFEDIAVNTKAYATRKDAGKSGSRVWTPRLDPSNKARAPYLSRHHHLHGRVRQTSLDDQLPKTTLNTPSAST